ncbi:unnamed protein product [Paramecium sonneborni]|uniref:Uncharacterized protein n=1 Tax=Paramecium sonneborni TaxID=65129 RepID=A0A8S1RQY6_9CILI|nr:unnamed protein product [Paramecium sonneborni]
MSTLKKKLLQQLVLQQMLARQHQLHQLVQCIFQMFCVIIEFCTKQQDLNYIWSICTCRHQNLQMLKVQLSLQEQKSFNKIQKTNYHVTIRKENKKGREKMPQSQDRHAVAIDALQQYKTHAAKFDESVEVVFKRYYAKWYWQNQKITCILSQGVLYIAIKYHLSSLSKQIVSCILFNCLQSLKVIYGIQAKIIPQNKFTSILVLINLLLDITVNIHLYAKSLQAS